ncbi:MAG: NADH-quinone oxidoreductase subunit NuoE [candidate division Zixibacteria bacterium]|nr:NADH-quinone oxidoreductase subunit NuoE [candidate division Zixibacteria bacterium]
MILNDISIAKIRQKMICYTVRKSAILPALTVACRQVGHLNNEIYREISVILEIPYLEVAEAASFYTMFPKKPVGRHLIQVCHNISCALLGADSLISYLEEKLGIKKGETSPDNLFTLISVECLGSCTSAPMIQIDDKYYELLTREKIDRILDDLKESSLNGKESSF